MRPASVLLAPPKIRALLKVDGDQIVFLLNLSSFLPSFFLFIHTSSNNGAVPFHMRSAAPFSYHRQPLHRIVKLWYTTDSLRWFPLPTGGSQS